MYVGVQFEAPDGFEGFRRDVRLYFAGDRVDEIDGVPVNTVLVVWFTKTKMRWQKWRVQTMVVPRKTLEDALTDSPKKLKILPKQFTLPPWMEEVDDVNFDEIEEQRAKAALRKQRGSVNEATSKSSTCRQQVEARLCKIAAAMEKSHEILCSPSPLKAIASTAYSGKHAKHPHRLQLWFFAYLLHGQNQWALKQPTHRNGLWKRSDGVHKDKKFGRPSVAGSCFGWSSAPMRKEIVAYYLHYAGLRKTMQWIHRTVLREKYGCITITDEDGNDIWSHPQNKPFPSYGQFRYVVVEELTLEFVQTTVYGAARMKSKATANDGCQTAQYANLLEELQVDAYFVSERPKSIHTDDPAEPLVVAEAVCVTSGAVVGVGFSLGSETGEAYRSMLFCMAAPKDYVARLYGVPPAKLNWIMRGISAAFTSDRGPAGHRKIAERLQQQFPVKTIAPSYDGQAKGPVESTHPRDVQIEGAPTWIQSDLTVIQMLKRELFRAASRNHTKDISRRLSDQAIADFAAEGRVATPHHYWQYLEARLRTSARQLTLEEAVRAFWTPVTLSVDRDGVKLGHRHYTSTALKQTKFMLQVGSVPNLTINAYTLSLVVRTIWVEVNGRLIELEATQRVRVCDEDRLVPLSELEATEHMLAELRSKTRTAIQAASNRAEADFQEVTGVAWAAGQRRGGTPKRASGTAAHEGKVLKGRTAKKVAA